MCVVSLALNMIKIRATRRQKQNEKVTSFGIFSFFSNGFFRIRFILALGLGLNMAVGTISSDPESHFSTLPRDPMFVSISIN